MPPFPMVQEPPSPMVIHPLANQRPSCLILAVFSAGNPLFFVVHLHLLGVLVLAPCPDPLFFCARLRVRRDAADIPRILGLLSRRISRLPRTRAPQLQPPPDGHVVGKDVCYRVPWIISAASAPYLSITSFVGAHLGPSEEVSLRSQLACARLTRRLRQIVDRGPIPGRPVQLVGDAL